MALSDAIRFISRIQTHSKFRESLYLCDGPDGMETHLKSLGYSFSYEEIEDAYRSMLVKCQSKDEAILLTEVYNLYRMLVGFHPVLTP